MGCSKSISTRKVYINTVLPQETRKTSNRQPSFTPKTTGKKRTKKPKLSRRKEIIRIRAEINEKEMKETTVKINKTKSWFFEKINKIDKPLARLIKKNRSDQISRSVVSDSLRPHESQHARPPCPSPTPGIHSDSCPSSQ